MRQPEMCGETFEIYEENLPISDTSRNLAIYLESPALFIDATRQMLSLVLGVLMAVTAFWCQSAPYLLNTTTSNRHSLRMQFSSLQRRCNSMSDVILL